MVIFHEINKYYNCYARYLCGVSINQFPVYLLKMAHIKSHIVRRDKDHITKNDQTVKDRARNKEE